MYIKIEGHLLDVLGDDARGNMEESLGIKVSPIYQFLEIEPTVTLATIVNEVKAEKIINDKRVTILKTKDDFNSEIDNLYTETFFLKNPLELQLDLQLSGVSTVENYNPSKTLSSQENLKALYEVGMGGITKTEKPPYLTE